MEKYYKLVNDLNLENNMETYKRYERLCLEHIEDYELCKRLMKQKDYVKSIKKLQKKYNMCENGVTNINLINKINNDFYIRKIKKKD